MQSTTLTITNNPFYDVVCQFQSKYFTIGRRHHKVDLKILNHGGIYSMQNLNEFELEHLYEQYLALQEVLIDKLPLELVYQIAQIHFSQISGADLGFALFRILWLGSDALIEDYLRIHIFSTIQVQDAFNRLAFMGTDEKLYCNGLDVAVERFLIQYDHKLRWLIQKGANPFIKYDGDIPFVLALEHGNMLMLKWMTEFAPVSTLRDELLSMSPQDFLRALSQQKNQIILGLSQEDMEYALIEAYEIHELDSTVLY